MSDKLRIALLAALVGGLALVWWIGGRAPEVAEQRSFRQELLAVDTAALQSFTIIPPLSRPGAPLQFQRDSAGWTVTQGNHSTPAFSRPLNKLFETLVAMRPLSMPGADPATLERYALSDSLAAKVVLHGTQEVTLRIGTTTSGEDAATAVIREGDPNVYLIPGGITWIMDLDFLGWIPKPMVNGDPENWERISFAFPGGVGYSLERKGDGWLVNGQQADNPRVDKYLYALSRYYGEKLADPADTLRAQLVYSIRVEDSSRKDPITLGIFDVGGRLIARSTLAPAWLVMPFDTQEELPRMFRPPSAFEPH